MIIALSGCIVAVPTPEVPRDQANAADWMNTNAKRMAAGLYPLPPSLGRVTAEGITFQKTIIVLLITYLLIQLLCFVERALRPRTSATPGRK